MGTRTYSRRSSTGERVLTAQGRARAGLAAIDILGNPVAGQTPAEVVNTPAPTIELPPVTRVDKGLFAVEDDLRNGKIPTIEDMNKYFPMDDPNVKREVELLGGGNEEEGRKLLRAYAEDFAADRRVTDRFKGEVLRRITREIGRRPGGAEYKKAVPDIASVMRQYIDGMNDTSRPESAREGYKQDFYGFMMNGYLPRGRNTFPPFTKREVDELVSGYTGLMNSLQRRINRNGQTTENSRYRSDRSEKLGAGLSRAVASQIPLRNRAEDEAAAASLVSGILAKRNLAQRGA